MRLFQLLRSSAVFEKRLRGVEEALEEVRRLVRTQDLDLSDALEKMQRMNARLAKRVSAEAKVDLRHANSPEEVSDYPQIVGSDPVSQRILQRRKNAQAATGGRLAQEAGDGILPSR
jgi:hypothetical protein